MKNLKRVLASATAIAGMAIAFTACKEDTIIKANVAPAVDNIGTFQITGSDIIAKTVLDDSVVTSLNIEGVPVVHGLGRISNDPYFGETDASIFFQVLPPKDGFFFPASTTIDSVVLILPYAGFQFGDTANTAPQTIRVFRMDESMSKDDTLYAFSNRQVKPTPMGEVAIDMHKAVADSPLVYGQKRQRHLRVPLDINSPDMQDLINNAVENNSNFANTGSFVNFFKGIQVTPDLNQNASLISYFFLDGSTDYDKASIAFYYHTATEDSLTEFFSFRFKETAHFNRIRHDYSGTEVKKLFDKHTSQPNVSDDEVALQNEPGAAIDLRIGLDNLPANVVINKAEIIITQKPNVAGNNTFAAPARIFPVGIDSTGKLYTLQDILPLGLQSSIDFVDGRAKSVNINGNDVWQYKINIPRELQRVIKAGNRELHLRINGTQTYYGAYRLVAGGTTGDPAYNISLNIVYSKLQ